MTREDLNKMLKQYFKKGGTVTVCASRRGPRKPTMKRAKTLRRVNPNQSTGYQLTNWNRFTN